MCLRVRRGVTTLTGFRPLTTYDYSSAEVVNPYSASRSNCAYTKFRRKFAHFHGKLSLISRRRRRTITTKPFCFQQVPQLRAATMQEHPEITWTYAKDF